jgi:hypothetical protein
MYEIKYPLFDVVGTDIVFRYYPDYRPPCDFLQFMYNIFNKIPENLRPSDIQIKEIVKELFRHYYIEAILCHSCHSDNTTPSRIINILCNDCNTKRTMKHTIEKINGKFRYSVDFSQGPIKINNRYSISSGK